jgi:DNA end-binding protein Ku
MELIKRQASKFEPDKFKDQYETAVRELVEAKIKHLPVPKDEEVAAPRRGQVINLMDALKKSVGGGAAEEPSTAKKKPAASAKKGISLVKSSTKRKSA